MESLEQPHKQESNEMDSLKSKEGLQSVIQILKETAEKFRAVDLNLNDEAEILLVKKDEDGYIQKLKDRAQLLIDLPKSLSECLKDVDKETKEEIQYSISFFVTAAQDALENGGKLKLLAFLIGKGEHKNDLENLIDSLERKQ